MQFASFRSIALLRRALLVSTAAWIAAWLAFPAAGFARTATLDILWVVVPVAAGLLCIAASGVAENETLRRSLRLLGAGALAWAGGQAVWCYYEVLAGHPSPYPSLADVGYLAAVPLIGLSLAFWPTDRRRRSLQRAVEAVLGAAAASLFVFAYFLSPAFASQSNGWQKALDVLYPLTEFGVAGIVAGAVLLGGWAERERIFLMLGGLASLATADMIYGATGYATGGLLDIGWTAAFLLIGLAGAPPAFTRRLRDARFPSWAWAAMVIALLVAVGAEHAKQDLQHLSWGAVVEFMCVLVLFVVLIVRFAIVHRRLEQEIVRADDAAAELGLQQAKEAATRDRFLAGIVAAREDEARRVAALLHDDAVQRLTALGLRLELAERRLGEPEIGRLAGEAREITRALRRLMTDLYPAVLESQGLAAAVEVAADSLREGGVDVRVSSCDVRVSHDLETIAYRVIHEALTNVAKHAGAAKVSVRISAGDVLRCEVRDDGVGFDRELAGSALARGSIGLRIARERVESAGGRMLIRSAPGEGTTLSFELPLDPECEVIAA